MQDDLRELYQAIILDHARMPRNFRQPANPDRQADGHNPMCGDQLSVYLRLDKQGRIEDAAFVGKGCAIAMASGSLMTEAIHGRTPDEADRLFDAFTAMCTSDAFDEAGLPAEERSALQSLHALSGVRAFPVRVRCATLAWQTLRAALHGEKDATSE